MCISRRSVWKNEYFHLRLKKDRIPWQLNAPNIIIIMSTFQHPHKHARGAAPTGYREPWPATDQAST